MRRDGRHLRFIPARGINQAAIQAAAPSEAVLLVPGKTLDWTTLSTGTHCFLVPLLDAAASSLPTSAASSPV